MSREREREAELQLCCAAECGDVYEVIRLLATGVAIDCTNERQQTPLMLSTTNTNAIRVTELLLEAGADADATSADLQMTALLYACKDNNIAALKLLLQLGANPGIVDVSRRSCFHYAALNCPPALLRELNRRTGAAFLNAFDSSGYTPLMLASEHGRTDNALELLELGANPLLRNKLNHQAIELADWFGHKRIVEELEAWFRRAGLNMRGEKVDEQPPPSADGNNQGSRNVPVSPASSLATPLPGGLMSPVMTTPAPADTAAESARAMAGDAHAPDPVGLSLAATRSTEPFT